MPNGRNIYAKASDMAQATMRAYPHSDHAIPHWKCVLQFCAEFPHINLPDQETNKKHEETTLSIRFHIYHIIGCCTTLGRFFFKRKTFTCVNKNLPEINIQKYTPEKN